MFIAFELMDNCAYAREPLYIEAQLINNAMQLSYSLEPQITDTLYHDDQVIYELTTSLAECDCCLKLMYLLKNMPHIQLPVKLNDILIE